MATDIIRTSSALRIPNLIYVAYLIGHCVTDVGMPLPPGIFKLQNEIKNYNRLKLKIIIDRFIIDMQADMVNNTFSIPTKNYYNKPQ